MTHDSGSEDDKGEEQSDKRSQPALPGMSIVKDALPLIGFLLLPAFALRALVTAHFDLTVAIALVQFSQPLNFALAFLLDIVPILIYAIGLVVVYQAGERHGARPIFGPGWLQAISAVMVGLATNVPILMTASDILYVGFPCITLASFFAWYAEKRLELNVRAYVAGFLSIFILSYGIFQGMWLAPEVLTIQSVPTKQYVLQQQDKDLIVYNPGLHAVIRVPVADVSHRQFCNVRSYTLAERIFDSPQDRPPCPK